MSDPPSNSNHIASHHNSVLSSQANYFAMLPDLIVISIMIEKTVALGECQHIYCDLDLAKQWACVDPFLFYSQIMGEFTSEFFRV